MTQLHFDAEAAKLAATTDAVLPQLNAADLPELPAGHYWNITAEVGYHGDRKPVMFAEIRATVPPRAFRRVLRSLGLSTVIESERIANGIAPTSGASLETTLLACHAAITEMSDTQNNVELAKRFTLTTRT